MPSAWRTREYSSLAGEGRSSFILSAGDCRSPGELLLGAQGLFMATSTIARDGGSPARQAVKLHGLVSSA